MKTKSTHLAALVLFSTIAVCSAQSTNADLSGLVPSVGTLSPAFDSATISYTANVAASSLTVTPTAADALATITVNGGPVVSGNASPPISLNFGPNVISTVVTAEDAVTTKTYTLTVTRTAPATITTAPVAYWPMRDGTAGQTVATGTGNAAVNVIDIPNTFVNGTVNNTNSTWQADPTRGIVWSTTEGNRINAGTQGIDLATGFTWSLWVNAATSNITDLGADCIIGTRSGWHKIDLTTISNWNGQVPSSGSYPNLARSEWIHIAYVGHSSFGRRLYVDGQLVGSNATTSTATFNGPLEIGGTGTFNEDITGLYSDVAIWNQALTVEQIADLANGANVITDVTAPVIATTTPADDDLNASSALVQAIFDEPVFVGSGNIRIVNDTDTVTTTIAVTDASQVTVSGALMTLNPSTPLIVGKSYHIEMDAGVVKNAENLNFGGIADSTTWNFTVDNTPPTLVSMVDSVSGGPIYEDQAFFFYTVTFNEPIDGTTVDASDFDNAGSATVSIGTVTQNSPTVFTVQVLPTTIGTLQLRIPAGSIVNDPSGNSLVVPVLDDTTIDILSGSNPGIGNRFWDGAITSGVTDGVSQGGTGAWNTSTTNWDRGLGFEGPVAWINNNSAIFGGTAGTVTLESNISLNGLTVSLPIAAGSGYSIGEVGENNTLTFPGPPATPGLVTVTATGNNSNQDTIIRAGIAGAPTMNIAARADNNANSFQLLPGADVTQSIGTLNMLNTLASNKRLILGGESTGNVVDTVTWSVTNNQMFLTKRGAGDWTITNDFASSTNRASRLYIEQGTLTLGGTNNSTTHKVGVATVIGTGFTATNLTSKLIAKGIFTINDNREYFFVQNAGTLSPGPGVETLTVRWNSNSAGTHGQFNMQIGSTYEWDVASSTSTDVIDVQRGGSSSGSLTLGDMTIKVNDAGVTTPIAAADQLTVFTYQTGVTRSIGTVTIDTTSLGAGWSGTPSLVDDGAGTIYVTGLTFASGPPSPFDTWANGTFANGTLTDKTAGGDDEGDTLTNLREFAFGTDPTVNFTGPMVYVAGGDVTTPGQPVLLEEGGTYYAVFGRRKDHVAAGLTYTVQFSADLISPWFSSAAVPVVVTGDPSAGDIEAVRVPFPGLIATDSGPKQATFFRLEVLLAP